MESPQSDDALIMTIPSPPRSTLDDGCCLQTVGVAEGLLACLGVPLCLLPAALCRSGCCMASPPEGSNRRMEMTMSIGRIVARYGLGAIRINRATIQLIRFCLDVPLGYPRCCQPPICSCANWVDAVHMDADIAAGVPPCDWLLPHVSEDGPTRSWRPAGGCVSKWLEDERVPIILYLHGGGYVFCTLHSHRDFMSRIVHHTGAVLLAVDYRRAPEATFPVPVKDCLAAYRWLVEAQAVAPKRIVIAGDSAGGALTISTAAAARDQGLPMPAGLLALSPWSDLADNDSSPSWRSQRDFLPPALVQQMARAYAGAASEMEASACNVDLHGFPRTLIVSGESEIFYSQICRLQHKLERAGVEVTHHHAPSMGHVFVVLGLPFGCPAAAKAMDAMATHVAETTNLPPICAGPGETSGPFLG